MFYLAFDKNFKIGLHLTVEPAIKIIGYVCNIIILNYDMVNFGTHTGNAML
ncbi:MAG: hypothetical protein ACK5H1_01805 [Tenacibaculum sp.]